MQKRLLATSSCAIVLALGLGACGGGDARPQPAPPPPSAPTPSPTPSPAPAPTPTPSAGVNYDTAEYQRSNGAAAAGAISAYDSGATGKGIKIGVIDTGIDPTNSEFKGKIDSASRDVAGSRTLGDDDGHGTAVSAVAAAAKDNSNMHGVAFDSTIVALRADQPGSCADENDGCSFYDGAISKGVDAARLAGAKVINMSLGGSSPSSTLLQAIQRAVNAGIVVVMSAGNDGEKPEGANADRFALIPAQTFPGQVIIAGSVGVDNGLGGTNLDQLSTFSNRAGDGQTWYLSALGYRVRAPGTGGQTYLWSGTSFSAPVISGAVALMAQAFPNLTARQIVDILFTTADDLGASGTDRIHGRGRLNLGRAFQPAGKTTVAGTEQEVDTSASSDLPAAAGDSDDNGTMGIVILDGYSRAFAMNVAATLRRAEQARPLARALAGNVRVAGASAGPVSVAMTVSERKDLPLGFAVEKLGIGPEDARTSRLVAGSAIAQLDGKTAAAFGFSEGAKAIERRLTGAEAGAFLIARDIAGDPGFAARRDGSVALRREVGSVGVTLSAESGKVWQDVQTSATGSPYRWTSLSLDRSFGSSWVSAGVSRLDERRTLLGGRMGEVLGGGGSSSLFVDVEARRDLGSGFSAGLRARRGWTDFAGGRFQTGAYGVDVMRLGVLNESDRLGLRLSQPLRIENGGFAMTVPTGYDYSTGLADTSLTRFSLSPSGREVDAELSYSTGLAGGWFGGNLFMRREPGHIANADTDYGAAIRFTLGF